VDFCLQTDDLRGDTAAFRRAGVDIADPSPLSRVRPDGYQLKWVLSISQGSQRGVAPFLIQDETPREERVPQQTRHSNGVQGIATVTVAVADVPRVRGWYAKVLGQNGQDVRCEDLQSGGVRFTVGPHMLEFLSPAGPASPLTEWLAARGPSPYAATLRGGSRGLLDPAKSVGARLFIV
jgi:hypothetical protein